MTEFTEAEWLFEIKQASLHKRKDEELLSNETSLFDKVDSFDADIALTEKYPDAIKRDIYMSNPDLSDAEIDLMAADKLTSKKNKRDRLASRVTLIEMALELRAKSG